MPRRGRHDLGLARIALRRTTAARSPVQERTAPRVDRRREQLPLPPGFVDRRRPRA